jgi:hypothetical protein
MTIGSFLLQTLINTALIAGAFYLLYGFIF